MLCKATDTLIDSTSEDWLLEDAVSSVVVGELTCLVVGNIVNDSPVEELLDTVLDKVIDEANVLLLEVLD